MGHMVHSSHRCLLTYKLIIPRCKGHRHHRLDLRLIKAVSLGVVVGRTTP